MKPSSYAFKFLARPDFEPGEFGYVYPYWCESCGGQNEEPGWHTTSRQTWHQPEEGYSYCRSCGHECYENDYDHSMKVVNRRRVCVTM